MQRRRMRSWSFYGEGSLASGAIAWRLEWNAALSSCRSLRESRSVADGRSRAFHNTSWLRACNRLRRAFPSWSRRRQAFHSICMFALCSSWVSPMRNSPEHSIPGCVAQSNNCARGPRFRISPSHAEPAAGFRPCERIAVLCRLRHERPIGVTTAFDERPGSRASVLASVSRVYAAHGIKGR